MTSTSRSMTTAMLCAAAVAAQFVSGKATRDALFLTSLPVTALPTMLVATSLFSIGLVAAHARGARLIAPGLLVPASFVVSGLGFLAEWWFRSAAPAATAVVVYLHVSGAGPLLASGFWLVASERFNPRTAKKGFGRVAAVGTLGGLVGALLSERVAAMAGVPTMLPILASLQFIAAGLVSRLAASASAAAPAVARPRRSGLRVIADSPHLRTLVALVLLGTIGAALVDYVFKTRAVETFGRGDGLLRFFALYYAVTSLISFVLQIFASRAVLERFGLALTASTPSIALLAGSLVSLVAPGFGSLLIARGSEAVFRGSWFRSGYELFYSPLPSDEKRTAKSVIDVAFERVGDALGGGLVRLTLVFLPAIQSSAMLAAATVSSLGAIVAASYLNRWYIRTLEHSLVTRARFVDGSVTGDESTEQVVRNVRTRQQRTVSTSDGLFSGADHASAVDDPVVRDILRIRWHDREASLRLLARDEGLAPALVPHVIPLLALDVFADHALFALRKVAEERVGELTDALLDPNQGYAVRRRLARVFSVCVSQRAADGLLLALDDARFDVRFQAARSLAAVLDKNPRIQIDRARIEEVVLREVAVSRPVWESRRLLDGFISASPLDEFVRDRAGQSLAHVFTLLSLVLPREPLQLAFRSLHSGDPYLRGTALEYLESVLPTAIRLRLWPFLVHRRVKAGARPQEGVIASLLGSSESPTFQGIAAGLRQARGRLGRDAASARVAGFERR